MVPETQWPAPALDAAYHGLAGEFVQLTEPHTEADPLALLAQFLVAFGTAAGRHAYYEVEASRHYPNEYLVLVGPSGKGRKGSSWDHVELALGHADRQLVDKRTVSGMSSGEGLIAEVRDTEDTQSGGTPQDKRLLVLEPEFAQVMKVLAREGNTLSPVIRNGWDGKRLQTLVRAAPQRATGAHIGIVGHITKDELLRYLTATELANGFFNRFLVIAVRRSKELPFGGRIAGNELAGVRRGLVDALAHASTSGRIKFSAPAATRWIEVYSELSRGRPGMLGAATARAEAHVCRLALIYALLDGADHIDIPHLEAALALWSYAARSARWVFGDSLGDPTADDIWALARERPGGISRTDVRDLFSRNKKAREIDRALVALVEAGRLRRGSQTDGRGRPAEVWLPARRAA